MAYGTLKSLRRKLKKLMHAKSSKVDDAKN